MKTYTVAELAKLSGVSIRTLHHYDDIGLLKPAFTGENRYRYYGHEELLRLQQILIHRELGIPLSDISALIDAAGFDRLQALRQQRERLHEQAKRFAGLVRTIDRTIAALQGDRVMKDADLYKGIMPEKQAEYEAWLIETYGGDMEEQIAVGRKKFASLTDDERQGVMAELKAIEDGLAKGQRNGVPPQAALLDPLLKRHSDWVGYTWQRPVTPEAYIGLAELYQSHPDFVARFEQIEKGFTDYLVTAMKSWAGRQGRWNQRLRAALIMRTQEESIMNKDHVAGAGKQAKGAIKEAAGKLTDNPKLKAEGKIEKAAGKVQSKVGDAKDKIKDARKH